MSERIKKLQGARGPYGLPASSNPQLHAKKLAKTMIRKGGAGAALLDAWSETVNDKQRAKWAPKLDKKLPPRYVVYEDGFVFKKPKPTVPGQHV